MCSYFLHSRSISQLCIRSISTRQCGVGFLQYLSKCILVLMAYVNQSKINQIWHQKHTIPMPSTLEQRVRWHIAHLKHCGCRKDLPPTIVLAMKADGKKVCSRGHVYSVSYRSCPVCWPGGVTKKTKK